MLICCYLGVPSNCAGGNLTALDHFHGQTVTLGTRVAVPAMLHAAGIAAAALPWNGTLGLYFPAPVVHGGQFNCMVSYA